MGFLCLYTKVQYFFLVPESHTFSCQTCRHLLIGNFNVLCRVYCIMDMTNLNDVITSFALQKFFAQKDHAQTLCSVSLTQP